MKRLIRRLLRRFGLGLHRIGPTTNPVARVVHLMASHRVDLVLDVGANTGQYASRLLAGGYPGRIVSFEPLPDAHQACLERSRGHDRWTVAPRVAVGDRSGTITVHVSGNSQSSSILEMLPTHTAAAPNSAPTGEVEAPLEPLDHLAPEHLGPDDRPFLKIDTQGSEGLVLDGAGQTLGRLVGLQVEMSLVPLYAGAPDWRQVVDRLAATGFEPHALLPGFSDPATGRMYQFDGVFFRSRERER